MVVTMVLGYHRKRWTRLVRTFESVDETGYHPTKDEIIFAFQVLKTTGISLCFKSYRRH